MDNENKNIQENELTPEERVQEDISNKIADAAAEIQEEILEANGEEIEEITEGEEIEETEVADESWSDEAWEEPASEEIPVVIKKSNFILSLIAAALVGVIITVCCFQAPTWIASIPQGSTVASVGDTDITDLDLEYYIFVEVYNYAQKNGIDQTGLADIDWDEEVDGVKLADKIKADAVNNALKEAALIEKGTENSIELDKAKKAGIDSQIDGFIAQYGKEGFELQLKSTGIGSIKEYTKLVRNNTLLSLVRTDIDENPDNYYPEDKDILVKYAPDDKVSAKHILIKVEEGDNDAEKQALAQSILDRINAGEDFDALMAEFNEDTGEPEYGYTFGKGEMVAPFEEAAFALQVDQISELVKSEYGYHIIKRVTPEAGEDELALYLAEQSGKKVNEKKIAKISVESIVDEIVAALEELEAQQSAEAAK